MPGLTTLAAQGVTRLINCRIELDISNLLPGTQFAGKDTHGRDFYLWNGTEDWKPLTRTHKTVDWFQRGIEYALPLLAEPRERILVSCHAGANRSATLAWTILRAFGLTETDCFAVIDTHRAIDIPGLIECGWWKDGNNAVKYLGYIRP